MPVNPPTVQSHERPGRVLYDEKCGFCRFTLALLLWADRRRAFTPMSFAAAIDAGLLDPAHRQEWGRSFHLVVGEDLLSGGDAIPAVLVNLRGGRPLARVARASPKACRVLYGAIAARRRGFGRVIPSRWITWADGAIRRRSSPL
jgi:predicted DCC family thiol-disulfide oxidoreductase YuxK